MKSYIKPVGCFIPLLILTISLKGKEIELFNGENLDGWIIENSGQFSVVDGILKLDRGTGWLRSASTFQNFILTLEFRFLEKEANSGIFVRTGATSKQDENGWPDDGYQVQCMDILDGRAPLGTMIPYGAPPFQHVSNLATLSQAYNKTGEWNRFEITAIDKTLRVVLNDKLITLAVDIENLEGHVGIQGENGLLEFRLINIREL